MALLSTGRTTGLVIDIGLDTTRAVTILEGKPNAVNSTDLGGKDVSNYIENHLLSAQGY